MSQAPTEDDCNPQESSRRFRLVLESSRSARTNGSSSRFWLTVALALLGIAATWLAALVL